MKVTLKRDIAANMMGRLWVGAMGFAFVPAYIHWLGIEAFGLIGLSATLMAIFAMLDLGLSTTINREFAHRRGDASGAARASDRDLLRSFEIVYWMIGTLVAGAVIVAAPLIATKWLKATTLDDKVTIEAIRLIGITILFRWPVSLYTGALLGLRRQISLNVVLSLYATLQGAGVLLVFTLLRPGIDLFFIWQAVAAALQVGVLAVVSWSAVGGAGRPARFSRPALRGIFGFSAGVMGITLLSIVLTQMDKIVLSRVLPLQQFGYYALAGSLASILNLAAMAINSAAFPALSQAAASGDEAPLTELYHKSCQYLAVAIIPPGLALAIFAREALRLYIADATVAANTHEVLSVLALGNMMLGLMVLPLSLQLAHGWTNLSLIKNLIAVVLFLPALLAMVHLFGMVGAALTWLMLTIGYFVGEIVVMHHRLLRGQKMRWYLDDIALPALAAGVVLLAGKLVFPEEASATQRIVALIGIGISSVAAAAATIPDLRRSAIAHLRRPVGGTA